MNPHIRGLLSEANMKWLSASAMALLLAFNAQAAQDAGGQKPAGRENKDIPLVEAVKKGDIAAVRALLQKKTPVDQPEADGRKPMVVSPQALPSASFGNRAPTDLLVAI